MQKFYQFQGLCNIRSKFIFEVGGSSEFAGGSVETKLVSTSASQENNTVQEAYNNIRGQLKQEEISRETQSNLFSTNIEYQAKEAKSDNKISEYNSKITSHKSTITTLSSQRKALKESNDSDSESSIILGLMPNSHEGFVSYVKKNRPSTQQIKSYLENSDLEEIPDEQINSVSSMAANMVAKLNQIDALSSKIKQEEGEVTKLEDLNKEEKAKKEADLAEAKTKLQSIVSQNVPPEPEEESNTDPSHSSTDRRSELPEIASQELATPEEDQEIASPEVAGPGMTEFYKGQAQAKTEEITESHEIITGLIDKTALSDAAKEQIMANIKRLEYAPGSSEEEIIAMVLAGVTEITPEQLKDTPYFAALKQKLQLIKERSEIQSEIAAQQKSVTLQNVSALVDSVIKDSAIYTEMLSSDTFSKFTALQQQIIDSPENVNFTEALALINQAKKEIESSPPRNSDEREAFLKGKRVFLTRLDRYESQFITYQTREMNAVEKAQEAEETRAIIQQELTSYRANPNKLAAAKSIAASTAFQETGKISAPVAQFLTNTASDFSPENVQKVVKLLNSEDYVNASEEQQEAMFESAGINLAPVISANNINLDSLTPEHKTYATSFIGALPEGTSTPQVLPNGNLAYEASGVEIEVDLEAQKMFPRSADGRSRTWLSMDANPINTPAIQFFSAAMGASVDDKEDGFASIMRGGGQWKNEIFWRNLLAPTTGRSLQHKEIAGIKAIENTVGIQKLMTHLELIDDSGNFVPGKAAQKRDQFFSILTSAANGSFETFAEKPAGTPLTELPE